MSGPRILIFDIETSPHLSWHFGTRNLNIRPEQIKQPTRMICWAAKWYLEKPIYFRSEYHHCTEDMVQTLWKLLDEADMTVTYNGDKFDHPHAAREFRLMELSKPSPSISVDLYKVIKKNEVYASHQMGYISGQLELPGKLSHSGFRMWREAMGDFGEEAQHKAWGLMRRYNRQDLLPTEALFTEYLPVIPNLPSAGLFADPFTDEHPLPVCPNPLCLSTHVVRQGYKLTKTRRYRQYQCQDCRRWFSETRSEMGVTET